MGTGFSWDKEWQRNMCVFSGPTQKCWGGKVKSEVAIWGGGRQENCHEPEATAVLTGIPQCSSLQLRKTWFPPALVEFPSIRNRAGWLGYSAIREKSVVEQKLKLTVNLWWRVGFFPIDVFYDWRFCYWVGLGELFSPSCGGEKK